MQLHHELKSPMEDLNDLLAEVLEQHDVPSLAAAVVFGGEVHAAGAVGVRKRGDSTPVTVNDKYHIGSCTKAMTATLAGILVERELLSWETTLSEVFPEMDIHPGYQPVTLKQLLSHTAGLPGQKAPESEDEEDDGYELGLVSPMEDRLGYAVPGTLKEAPHYPPGQVFDYANIGYGIAGAVLEQLTQTPFETLIEREYFTPLGITSAGFGAAGTPGKVDEPWGHGPEPVEPGPEADNPPVLSPAGTIHMSITDFARHAMFHLTGKPELVSRETLDLLHTPVKEDYALGWRVSERLGFGGTWLTHNGSNTLSLAFVGLAPAKNRAVLYATNLGTQEGIDTAIKLFEVLAKHYLQQKSRVV